MPYITRDDGEHFVIPSYRDVLAAKNKNQLKKDILLLSQSYGEYITLQRKNVSQYEIAFSPDTGHLLGESIWHHFKRPLDMIYCEVIPDTTEAILVIVKAGSVYLDGSFPLEGIAEELIIFLTQQNNFEIYIYGDVPIAAQPTEGKFNFEPNSVKSFTVLDKPVFPTLPLVKMYQLQLVEPVLKAQGIGVFPIKQLITGIVILGLLWMLYSYLTTPSVEVEKVAVTNPYQIYINTLRSPAPDQEIPKFLDQLELLYALPGWVAAHIDYAKGMIAAKVISGGNSTQALINWTEKNQCTYEIKTDGIYINMPLSLTSRTAPTKIYVLKQVIADFIDKLAHVYPGNHLRLEAFQAKGSFTTVKITISVDNVSPFVLNLIGEQFKDLPFVIDNISLDVNNGSLTGDLVIHALGS